MAEAPQVSAAALQIMSLLDRKGAADFRKFCAVVATFRFYPAHDQSGKPNSETQNIDLMNMTELGLIRHDLRGTGYEFGDFSINFGFGTLMRNDFSLTQRGCEIANTVFVGDADLKLSEEVALKYLQDVTSNLVSNYNAVHILREPKQGEPMDWRSISLTHPTGPAPVKEGDFSGIEQKFSERLGRLLKWAATRYDLRLAGYVPEPSGVEPCT